MHPGDSRGAVGERRAARGGGRVEVTLSLAAVWIGAAALAIAIAARLEQRERFVVLAACAAFAVSALVSPNSYVHDDYTHFRHARGALGRPAPPRPVGPPRDHAALHARGAPRARRGAPHEHHPRRDRDLGDDARFARAGQAARGSRRSSS